MDRQRIRPSRAELTDDLEAALAAYQSEPSAKLYHGPPSAFAGPKSQTETVKNPESAPSPSPRVQRKTQSRFKQAMAAQRQQSGSQPVAAGLRPQTQKRPDGNGTILGLTGNIQERSVDKHGPPTAPSTDSQVSAPFGFPQSACLFRQSASLPTERAQHSPTNESEDSLPTPVHFENLAQHDADDILAHMSEEEILREQQELKAMLDPSTVEFLLNRHKKQPAQHHVTPEKHADMPAPSSTDADLHPVASTSTATDPDDPLFDTLGRIPTSATTLNPPHSSHDPTTSRSLDAWLAQTRSAVPQQRASALSTLTHIVRQQWDERSVRKSHPKLLSCTTTCLATNTHRTVLANAIGMLEAIRHTSKHSEGLERIQEVLLALEDQGGLTPLDALSKALDPKTSSLPSRLRRSATLFLQSFTSTSRTPQAATAIFQHESLMQNALRHAFDINWPASSEDADVDVDWPDLTMLDILQDFSLERSNLHFILKHRPVELMARFIAMPYWTLDHPAAQEVARQLTVKIFDLLSSWATFGVGCELRSSLASLWAPFELHQWDLKHQPSETEVVRAWFRLLKSWMVAASSPHATTPEHAVLWSQVSGWQALLQDATTCLLSPTLSTSAPEAQAEILFALHAFEQGRVKWQPATSPINLTGLDPAPMLARFVSTPSDVGAAWIYALICLTFDAHAEPLKSQAESVFRTVLCNVEPLGRPAIPLLYKLWPLLSISIQTVSALQICSLCDATEVDIAASLLSPVIDAVTSSSAAPSLKQILCPLIPTSCGIAPFQPTPSSLKTSQSILRVREKVLGTAWYLKLPLDELFNSATSKVLRQLPKQYDFSELEMVRAALEVQVAVLQSALKSLSYASIAPDQRMLLHQIMRIFLLEKEDGRPTFASTTMRAIFRDEKTSQLVREALHLLPQLDPRRPWPEGSDLAALYAEFSDLLDLFDAISFADENFSRVVLLMVADRSLPSDFRAMLFAEHPQAIPRLAIGAPGSYLGKETTVNDPGMLKTIYSKLALEGADPGLRSVCQHLANDAQG